MHPKFTLLPAALCLPLPLYLTHAASLCFTRLVPLAAAPLTALLLPFLCPVLICHGTCLAVIHMQHWAVKPREGNTGCWEAQILRQAGGGRSAAATWSPHTAARLPPPACCRCCLRSFSAHCSPCSRRITSGSSSRMSYRLTIKTRSGPGRFAFIAGAACKRCGMRDALTLKHHLSFALALYV